MKKEIIPWKFHPRVFNSLGTDLVTDDIVAINELVKNSYDAGANEVIISFLKDTSSEKKQVNGKNAAEVLAILTAYCSERLVILLRDLTSSVILIEAIANKPRITIIAVSLKRIFIRFLLH
jgi:hypothetical protein